MAQGISSVALFGSTGLVGSNILKTLLDLPSKPQIHAISRRSLAPEQPNLNELVEPDSEQWLQRLRNLTPAPDTFITALGTTRRIAGSFEAQRKIDYDLNLTLAKAAKERGSKICVLISSAGTSANSMFPYGKMKAELENAVKELGFSHLVIVRPGLLLGQRRDTRPPEFALRMVATALGALSNKLVDFWAQDASVIARAAVSAALECAEGKKPEGVTVVEQADILRLGRS